MDKKIYELGELNISFYTLFCKYDRYKDKLSEPMAKYMADKLFSTYKEEYERIFSEYYIEREREKFEIKEKRIERIPKRWRAWWSLFIIRRSNKAAKLIDKHVEKETEEYFKECEAKLTAEREQIVPVKSESPTPQNPENGNKVKRIGAHRPDTSSQKREKERARKQGSTNGASNQSEQPERAEPAKKKDKK